jgi:4-alpha-glucanotransferase
VSATAWGIQRRYTDATRRRRAAPRRTVQRALHAMRAGDAPPPGGPRIVAQGAAAPVAGRVDVVTEGGAVIACEGVLPPTLPIGYHSLVGRDGAVSPLIVTPGRCRPPGQRLLGFVAQLYASRSRRSWGIGDLGDLRTLAAWSRSLGVGLVLVNPLHAPVSPGSASPYAPGSRRYRNPLYIDIDQVPGVDRVDAELASVREQIARLNGLRVIDRESVHRLKMIALERIWDLAGDVPELDVFLARDAGLTCFATFSALAEVHGPSWRSWPAGLRRPDADGVGPFAGRYARRVRFHAWLQWLLDSQLARAAEASRLVNDLAVGCDPNGADAWEWQDLLVPGFELGAPADEFNTRGQRWGIAAFDPWRLRAAGYAPFIATLRAAFRHAAGLRVDHVMGLFRLWWVPQGGEPTDGVYVRYPSSALLDVLALESARCGAFVVGEDLGTVGRGVRAELARRDVLVYRLLWFDRRPQDYPRKSLCGVTTHDLPTVIGLWTGTDVGEQERLGLHPDLSAHEAVRSAVAEATGLARGAPPEDVVAAVHRVLASAPSRVVTATLEDLALVAERPNIPGTVDERPNWSLALPIPIEELMASPLPARVARELRDG